MKPKYLAAFALLVAFSLALSLATWGVQAQSTSGYPAPAGITGKVVSISGDIVEISTDANVSLQFRIDATTVILRGGFSNLASIGAGEAVVIDPAFSTYATKASPDDQAPDTSNQSGGSDSGQPSPPSDTEPPSGSAPPSPLPNQSDDQPPANTAPVARLIWAPQPGETLTTGVVRSATSDQISMVAGPDIFTVLLDKSTTFLSSEVAGSPASAATDAAVGPGTTILILGTPGAGSGTIVARSILVQLPAPGASSAPR